MIDFILDVLFTPGPVWVGVALGVLVAFGAWYFLPETIDRTSIGAWAIAIGFVGGWLISLPIKKKKL